MPACSAYAPEKRPETIRKAMADVRLRKEAAAERSHTGAPAPAFAPAGQSTQMIVGADGANDATILGQSTRLYVRYKLKRVYYSAFSPIPDATAALPLIRPPLEREHRLYQADWLLRFYGFDLAEITGATRGRQPRPRDRPEARLGAGEPAASSRSTSTVRRARCCCGCPASASKTVARILAARRHRTLRYDDLARMGATMKKARPFVDLRRLEPRRADRQRRSARPLRAAARAAGAVLMPTVRLPRAAPATAWRDAARGLLGGRHPARGGDLEFGDAPARPVRRRAPRRPAPGAHDERARKPLSIWPEPSAGTRDPERFARLYAFLWRLAERDGLMADRGDAAPGEAARDGEGGAPRQAQDDRLPAVPRDRRGRAAPPLRRLVRARTTTSSSRSRPSSPAASATWTG